MKRPAPGSRRYLPGSPFNVAPVSEPVLELVVGDRVTHDEYGLGTVIGVEPLVAVLVDFGSRQVRLITPYYKLAKL